MLNPDELKRDRLSLELCKQMHPLKWERLTSDQRRQLVNHVRPDSSDREIERAFRKVTATALDAASGTVSAVIVVALIAAVFLLDNRDLYW